MDLKQKRMTIMAVLVLIGGLFLIQSVHEKSEPTFIVSNGAITSTAQDAENLILTAETSSSEIMVHVTGAVENPGVYKLYQGQRVEDAIQKAILAENADADALNRAAVLSDGQKIIVPFLDETKHIASDGTIEEPTQQNDKLNINQADLSAFMELPGIGEVKARAIVQYRTEHGAFQTTDELLQITGIGPATYANIAEFICI